MASSSMYKLFKSQDQYDSFNRSLSELFGVDYKPHILLDNEIESSNDNSGNLNGFYGQKHTIETKLIMSAIHSGKTISDYQKQRIIESNKTRENTPERNKKISDWHKGRKKTDEHKKNISVACKNRIKTTCPHCNKTGDASNMSRWHGENCKFKK